MIIVNWKLMADNLCKSIIATIVYYDILDYPLTSFEIWKHLMSRNAKRETHNDKFGLVDVIRELENSNVIREKIEEYQGFYFLKNRKELVEKRIESNKISERKFGIIKKAVRFLKFVPFVRMIAVTGRMAMKNADKKSDLDLLIAIKDKKIFTGRILVTFLVHVLGIRRYGRKISDRICLNYFMTDKNMRSGLDELFSSSEHSEALHLFASSEYSFVYPVFGWEIFQKFQKENRWIGNWKINYCPDEIAGLKLIKKTEISKTIRKIGEALLNFNFIEKFLKKWQMRRIMNDPRTHKTGSFVTASDRELIFLPCPQGTEIYEQFSKKLDETA